MVRWRKFGKINCNKPQEIYFVSRAKISCLGGVDKIGIGPGRTGLDHGSITDRITEKNVLKKKKIPKNQIVYELVINKK